MTRNPAQAITAQGRFGVIQRALVAVPAAMAVWWFLLKPASLWLLRILAYFPLAMFVAPRGAEPLNVHPETGEWVFNVAVNAVGRDSRTGQQLAVSALEFAAKPDDVAFFACGWFSYLGLALSAGAVHRTRIGSLLKGLGLQTAINLASVVTYVYVNGQGIALNTPGGSESATWFFRYIYHLVYLVVPFAGPFLLAVWVYPEWRDYFGPRIRSART